MGTLMVLTMDVSTSMSMLQKALSVVGAEGGTVDVGTRGFSL